MDPSSDLTVSPPETLVSYEAPIFIGIDRSPNNTMSPMKPPPTGTDGKIEDMLNAMFSAREWMEESGVWAQNISKDPATRLDVISLQEKLDKKLSERKARETGICSVREELYSQCFDEMIRQVTLDGPERGLLLMRVRDEVRMAIDAYKMLYSSSVTFGIKKQLKAEEGIPALEEQVAALEVDNAQLEMEVGELRSKSDILEKRESERRAADEKRRKDEIDFLKHQHQHLDQFLKQMGVSK